MSEAILHIVARFFEVDEKVHFDELEEHWFGEDKSPEDFTEIWKDPDPNNKFTSPDTVVMEDRIGFRFSTFGHVDENGAWDSILSFMLSEIGVNDTFVQDDYDMFVEEAKRLKKEMEAQQTRFIENNTFRNIRFTHTPPKRKEIVMYALYSGWSENGHSEDDAECGIDFDGFFTLNDINLQVKIKEVIKKDYKD